MRKFVSVSWKIWNISSAYLNLAGDRRKAILDTLKQRGLDIHVAPYNVWGANLTLLIRRAKIVLNLHYHEARTLETCRIMESTSLGALVSQNSLVCYAAGCDPRRPALPLQ
jgi:hypothetical protein